MGRNVRCSWLTHSPLQGKVQEVGILVGGDDETAIKAKKDDVSRKRKTDDGESHSLLRFLFASPSCSQNTLYIVSR